MSFVFFLVVVAVAVIVAAAGPARRHADGDLVTAIGGFVEGPRARGWARPLIQVALVVLAVVWIVPFAWAVATSLKPDAETTVAPVSWLGTEQTLDAYRIALEDGRILTWYFNSLHHRLADHHRDDLHGQPRGVRLLAHALPRPRPAPVDAARRPDRARSRR